MLSSNDIFTYFSHIMYIAHYKVLATLNFRFWVLFLNLNQMRGHFFTLYVIHIPTTFFFQSLSPCITVFLRCFYHAVLVGFVFPICFLLFLHYHAPKFVFRIVENKPSNQTKKYFQNRVLFNEIGNGTCYSDAYWRWYRYSWNE